METFKSHFQARRYAKNYFASLLNISPRSVTVLRDTYFANSSSRCTCGECSLLYFEMSNAGPMQRKKLEIAIDRPGSVIALRICKDCGDKF